MILNIDTLKDLNTRNLENAIIILMLNENEDNSEKMRKMATVMDYPETIIAFLKDPSVESRNFILNEINRRCSKRGVYSIDSIVVFRIVDGKAKLNPKRAINVEMCLNYKVASSLDELINIIAFHCSKSLDSFDREIKGRLGSNDFEFSAGITYQLGTGEMKPQLGIKRSKEINGIFKRIISK